MLDGLEISIKVRVKRVHKWLYVRLGAQQNASTLISCPPLPRGPPPPLHTTPLPRGAAHLSLSV